QPGIHGRIDNYADIPAQAERKYVLFDFSRQNRIGRLKGRDGSDAQSTTHLLNIEVRYSEITHLAFFFEAGHLRPTFFYVGVGIRPVNLVEIDDINFESAQAGFTLPADRLGFQ